MSIVSPSLILKRKRQQRPKTYFQLIDRVGSDGKYQLNLIFLFALIWFVGGATLINTRFLFHRKTIQCQRQGLLASDCLNLICQTPLHQRNKFFNRKHQDFISIANSFGDYYCEDEIYLQVSEYLMYLGLVVGFLVFGYLGDNFGRRRGLIYALGVNVFGNVFISSSFNLPMISVGLIIAMGSIFPAMNMTLNFFNQVVQPRLRQKYSILVQISFAFGTIILTSFYFIISHWRTITIILTIIPSLISLVFIIISIHQTPQFLLRGPISQAIKPLNKIGKLNYKIKDIIEQEDILAVKEAQVAITEFNEIKLNPLDVVRFSSLREITICCWILVFVLYASANGTLLLADKIKLDIFETNFFFQLTELAVIIPTYIYIERFSRKAVGIIAFSVSLASSIVLLVTKIPSICQECSEMIVYTVFLLIFRASIAMYTCVFYLYANELYPTRISGLGIGCISAVGALSSFLIRITVQSLKSNQINVMIIFSTLSFIALSITSYLQETKQRKLRTQIEQIQIYKQKQKAITPVRGSFGRFSMIKTVVRPPDIILEPN